MYREYVPNHVYVDVHTHYKVNSSIVKGFEITDGKHNYFVESDAFLDVNEINKLIGQKCTVIKLLNEYLIFKFSDRRIYRLKGIVHTFIVFSFYL